MAADLPSISAALRVWATVPEGAVRGLLPGRDLVLQTSRSAVDELSHGVLLDDWLDPSDRDRIDLEARRRLAAWLQRRERAVTVAGVPLGHIHELELYADVFLPEVRLVEGLTIVLTGRDRERVIASGIDRELADCLAARLGLEIEVASGGAAPEYPGAFRRDLPLSRRASGALREAVGFPGRPRGAVLFEPYWHLTPVWEILAEGSAEPVMIPFNRPALAPGKLLRSLRRGGWLGAPAAPSRARSALAVSRKLETLGPLDAGDELDRLLDRRCRGLLVTRARHTPAEAGVRRRAFRKNVRAAVAYSDSAPFPRLSAFAAREHDAPVITVQHGLFGHLPLDDARPARTLDGWVADVFAVWSEREREAFAAHVPGEVVVTGNPGAVRLNTNAVGPGSGGTALVLAQTTTPLSAGADSRVPAAHLRAGLGALSGSGVRDVIVRPHPLDRERDLYARIGAEFPSLSVLVDATGPVEAAIAAAGLCIGAVSTATLQAAAMGVPTVLLDLTGMELAWPFDGSGAFPTARSREELAELIGSVSAAREVALEALGARPEAADDVAEIIADAANAGGVAGR